jgi:DNA-binding transcriptional ArsR family regulator
MIEQIQSETTGGARDPDARIQDARDPDARNPDARIHAVVRFFKVLADESRLRILGILATRECGVEELAALLKLRAPTVSHHLARLRELGLVAMRPAGNTHLYRLESEALRSMSKGVLSDVLSGEAVAAPGASVAAPGASVAGETADDAWERKILRDFFEGERLKEIPASRKKRSVVLRWLAERFQVGERYPEAAVNALIGRHHPDFATLRRELIGAQLLERSNGVYWRVDGSRRGDAGDPPGGPGHDASGGEPAGRLAEVAVQ